MKGRAWSDPLSSPGRSTLLAGQPQFYIHLWGFRGVERLEVYQMFLNTLSNGRQPSTHPMHTALPARGRRPGWETKRNV